ncbi:TPA: response regulator transcription factor [Aeromonas veronii]|nr:response regulator transcription factor [Aeromonas veronii]
MARFIIVDDHPAIRIAVRMIIENDSGNCVVAEADNGVDAIQLARQLMPDLVVLDIGIPRLDGFEVIKRIKEQQPLVKIIVLSAHNSEHVMIRCLQSGAEGFISKLDDLMLLKEAVTACLNKKNYFPKEIVRNARYSPVVGSNISLNNLSDREMSVFVGLASGRTNKDIAADMFLSEKTVSTYKSRLMKKLKLVNMADLIIFAKKNNILQ